MKGAALVGAGLVALAMGPAAAAELTGTLDWVRRTELGTLVSGVVAAVPVRAGQSVAAGTELLRLDDRGFRARVAEAEAAVAKARVDFEEAEREDGRAAELYDRTVLSDHERQLAAIDLEAARATLQAARAQLTQARLDLERSAIRAPHAALVLRVAGAPGQVVVSELQSMPLVVVAEDGRMLVRANAGAAELAGVAPGAPARVGVRELWLQGTVAEVGLEPVAGTGQGARYEVTVVFDLPAGPRLRAGEVATLRLDAVAP